MSTLKDKATEVARKRYDRMARFFDIMEVSTEKSRYSVWRKILWSKIEGQKILEVGVGTGKNFLYYPVGADITAIDFSNRMLERARKKAQEQGLAVHLLQMDAQHLEFPDNSFDTIAGTFVFCSVPDPIQGLTEIERVLKPGGKLLLLEHVLSVHRIIAALMNLANPIVVRLMGANINRRTVENVTLSGLIVEKVTDLGSDIFKLIEARKKEP